MTPEQERLDDLLREMVELIAKAEDSGKIAPYLTFMIAPDGCRVISEWHEDSETGSLRLFAPPEVVFDNMLSRPIGSQTN